MISGILEKISPNSADLTQARAVRAVRYWYLVPNGAVQQCHELSFFFHCGVLLPSRVAARHNAPRRTAYASSRRPASRPTRSRKSCLACENALEEGASRASPTRSAALPPPNSPPGRSHLVGHTLQCQLGPSVKAAPPACPFSVQALRVTSIRSAAERTSVGLGDPPRCGPQAWNRRTSHRAQMTYSLYLSAHRHNPRLLGIKGGVAHIPCRYL